MLFKFPTASQAREDEVTPRELFLSRRSLMASGAAAMALGSLPAWSANALAAAFEAPTTIKPADPKFDPTTPMKSATTYNNFYEFGTGKSDPAENAGTLKIRPWEIAIGGEVAKPMTIGIEDMLKFPMEERIYRLRCVEAWSMVIPWIGFPLSELIKRVEPTGNARYLRFETLVDRERMPGV